jgi:hypothetical protein
MPYKTVTWFRLLIVCHLLCQGCAGSDSENDTDTRPIGNDTTSSAGDSDTDTDADSDSDSDVIATITNGIVVNGVFREDTSGNRIEAHGADYALEGMRYLPRQSVDINGTIADFEFYASMTPDDWGEPVASGTWPADQKAKLETFGPVTARYIRLVALSEINDGAWTCVAELDLLGSPAK